MSWHDVVWFFERACEWIGAALKFILGGLVALLLLFLFVSGLFAPKSSPPSPPRFPRRYGDHVYLGNSPHWVDESEEIRPREFSYAEIGRLKDTAKVCLHVVLVGEGKTTSHLGGILTDDLGTPYPPADRSLSEKNRATYFFPLPDPKARNFTLRREIRVGFDSILSPVWADFGYDDIRGWKEYVESRSAATMGELLAERAKRKRDVAEYLADVIRDRRNWFVGQFDRHPKTLADLVGEQIPLDPWGNPFQLGGPFSKRPDVWSAGPDGKEGTDDDVF